MSANQMAKLAELENQAFSLMGRLHVVLRRETGRITDVEYMRVDPAYCRHLIQLAAQSGHSDLEKIGERLYEIYFGEDGLFVTAPPKPPLLARLASTGGTVPSAPAVSANSAAAAGAAAPHPASAAQPARAEAATQYEASPPPKGDQHYVGRLR